MTPKGKPRHYRPRRSAQEWAELIARYERSGLSVAKFCAKEALVVSTFHRWQLQLRGASVLAAPRAEATVAPFVELPSQPAAASGFDIELALGRGVILRMRGR